MSEGDGYPHNVQGVEKMEMVMAPEYEKYEEVVSRHGGCWRSFWQGWV